MKKLFILIGLVSLCTNCNSQVNNNETTKENERPLSKIPKGNWKVNKEFDKAGNLIRYDSIYSWSSHSDLNELATLDHDSVLRAMEAKFYKHFSNYGLAQDSTLDFFTKDSLFSKHFFQDDFFQSDFGKDFMNLDHMFERMEAMQRHFLEKYSPNTNSEEKKKE